MAYGCNRESNENRGGCNRESNENRGGCRPGRRECQEALERAERGLCDALHEVEELEKQIQAIRREVAEAKRQCRENEDSRPWGCGCR